MKQYKIHPYLFFVGLCFAIGLLLSSCADTSSEPDICYLEVTATAYSPLRANSNRVAIGAWGDTLYRETRAIAVSRDLLKNGLPYRTQVRIEGLPGTYLVLDKMHYRWRNRIDLFLADDRDSALSWGRRKVMISWNPKKIE